MNLLPSCDRTTQRSELAVFLSLGLAGVMMILLATAQMTSFVAGSDLLNAALTGRPAPLMAPAQADANGAGVTNVSGPRAVGASVPEHTNGTLRSAAVSGLSLLLR